MSNTTAIEEIKYCFGTFHDRPLATFKDGGGYTWNRELVHECRTCEHLNACFAISTQVRFSREESLGGRRREGGRGGGDSRENRREDGDNGHEHHHHHEHRHGREHDRRHRHHHGCDGHHHGGRQRDTRKDILDILGDFVQMLKDTRG